MDKELSGCGYPICKWVPFGERSKLPSTRLIKAGLVGSARLPSGASSQWSFEDEHEIAKLAATCGLSMDEFRAEFAYLVEYEPPPLRLVGG